MAFEAAMVSEQTTFSEIPERRVFGMDTTVNPVASGALRSG
jgi:hypothetical protein